MISWVTRDLDSLAKIYQRLIITTPILLTRGRAVVILSVRGVLVRKFMLAAHALGMTRGEYLFLDVEIFQVIIVERRESCSFNC